jgi:hypothetical protein
MKRAYTKPTVVKSDLKLQALTADTAIAMSMTKGIPG